jgi:hypothetical protein
MNGMIIVQWFSLESKVSLTLWPRARSGGKVVTNQVFTLLTFRW